MKSINFDSPEFQSHRQNASHRLRAAKQREALHEAEAEIFRQAGRAIALEWLATGTVDEIRGGHVDESRGDSEYLRELLEVSAHSGWDYSEAVEQAQIGYDQIVDCWAGKNDI